MARSAGDEPATFSVRSHSPLGTRVDTEGQGETKQRFYQLVALLEGQGGTGRDTRLRSDCGQKLCSQTQLPWGLERGPEREGPGLRSRPRLHIAKHSLDRKALLRLQDRDPARDLYLVNRRRVVPGSQNSSSCQVFDTLILRQILLCKDQCLVGEREVYQKRSFLIQLKKRTPSLFSHCHFRC